MKVLKAFYFAMVFIIYNVFFILAMDGYPTIQLGIEIFTIFSISASIYLGYWYNKGEKR